MRHKKTERFGIGRVTVEVTRATPDLDNHLRGYYRCDIFIPGTRWLISRCWLRAFSKKQAAREAVKQYEAK